MIRVRIPEKTARENSVTTSHQKRVRTGWCDETE